MHVDEALILKFFQGGCSEEEIKQIEQWRKSNPDNQTFFDELAEIWQTSGELYNKYEPKKDSAWEAMSKKLELGKVLDKESKKLNVYPYIQWAAVLLLLISIGFFVKFHWSKKPVPDTMVMVMSGNSKKTCILPDSSVVTLDKNSMVQYNRLFKDSVRRVNLKGTAFFEVKPDKKHPFKVYTRNSRVEVVGTSFYLGVDSVKNIVNLIVISGKVNFYNQDKRNNAILVTKNEKAFLDLSNGIITKIEKYSPNEIVWKTGNFIFEEERLEQVCNLLSDYYNTKINLADTVMNKWRLTAGFHQQPLTNIIKAIETTFDLKADTVNHTVVLSKK